MSQSTLSANKLRQFEFKQIRPLRIDGIYHCNHNPWLNISTREVECSWCPKVLVPSDLTVGQVAKLTRYGSPFAIEVDGDHNVFTVVVI